MSRFLDNGEGVFSARFDPYADPTLSISSARSRAPSTGRVHSAIPETVNRSYRPTTRRQTAAPAFKQSDFVDGPFGEDGGRRIGLGSIRESDQLFVVRKRDQDSIAGIVRVGISFEGEDDDDRRRLGTGLLLRGEAVLR